MFVIFYFHRRRKINARHLYSWRDLSIVCILLAASRHKVPLLGPGRNRLLFERQVVVWRRAHEAFQDRDADTSRQNACDYDQTQRIPNCVTRPNKLTAVYDSWKLFKILLRLEEKYFVPDTYSIASIIPLKFSTCCAVSVKRHFREAVFTTSGSLYYTLLILHT